MIANQKWKVWFGSGTKLQNFSVPHFPVCAAHLGQYSMLIPIHCRQAIMALNEHHSISSHWQLGCLFYSLLRLTTRELQSSVILSLCEGNPPVEFKRQLMDSPHKGPVMQKVFPSHEIMVFAVWICLPALCDCLTHCWLIVSIRPRGTHFSEIWMKIQNFPMSQWVFYHDVVWKWSSQAGIIFIHNSLWKFVMLQRVCKWHHDVLEWLCVQAQKE